MIKTLLIEAKEIQHPVTLQVQGVATQLDLTLQYTVGEVTAKGYFEFKDENGCTIKYGRGNMEVDTADWANDDEFMFTRFAGMLNVQVAG